MEEKPGCFLKDFCFYHFFFGWFQFSIVSFWWEVASNDQGSSCNPSSE